MNEEVSKEEKKWFSTLLSYAKGSGGRLGTSIAFSVVSLISGMVPYYLVYRILDRYITGTLDTDYVLRLSLAALCAYLVKVICFGISTGISHYVAFNVLEGLRLKVADTFLKAPLGEVYAHSIGEIKGVIVDKIEDIEPPLAHVVPEGAGHMRRKSDMKNCLMKMQKTAKLCVLIPISVSIRPSPYTRHSGQKGSGRKKLSGIFASIFSGTPRKKCRTCSG